MENQKNGLAIASMVCGICSLVLYFFFGFVLAVLAVIFGHVQLSNISKNPKVFGGRGSRHCRHAIKSSKFFCCPC